MKAALIFGRGRGVWDEMVAARRLGEYEWTIAVGKSACDYPGFIDHWVSFHAELFEKWAERRRQQRFPMTGIVYWTAIASGRRRAASCNGSPVYEVQSDGGSSGLVAVRVAQNLGATHIVLAGIPMAKEFGHYDEWGEWDEAPLHRRVWEQNLNEFRGLVKSMSGWTLDTLGAPSREWLHAYRVVLSDGTSLS